MNVSRSATPPPTPHSGATSRRWFLAGAGAVVIGGAAGTAAELVLRRRHPAAPPPPSPPATLVAAAAAESALIADLDATTGGTALVRRVIVAARADHAAHLAALRELIAGYPQPSASPTHPTEPRGMPRTLAQLRAAELAAADAAARRAEALRGTVAAFFASIAACESTHAALLQ